MDFHKNLVRQLHKAYAIQWKPLVFMQIQRTQLVNSITIFTIAIYSRSTYHKSVRYAKCFYSNSALIGAFYNCTGTTLFNPSLQYCTTPYTCSVTTTTSTSTTTTTTTTPDDTTTEAITSTTTAPVSAQSICDSQDVAGLYPNPDDTLCKQ